LEPMLSIAKGAVSTIADGATSFVKKIFDEELKVDYKVGAGVQQWAGLAAKALQITGQYSAANLSYLLQQMQHESSGNPMSINLWDSNAKKGTPSKGLMQVIDPTFQSYAKPPYNKNIYDPLSNIIASIRYSLAKYGSLYNAWAKRGFIGYESGIGKITISDIIPGYANGGFPESGQLFMARENGSPEMVGKIGSRTVVANNEQITDAVAKAIAEKMNETTDEFGKIMNQLLKKMEKIFLSASEQKGVDRKSLYFVADRLIANIKDSFSSITNEFLKTGTISDNEVQSLLEKTAQIIEKGRQDNQENADALSLIYKSISSNSVDAFNAMNEAASAYRKYAESAKKETKRKEEIDIEINTDVKEESVYDAAKSVMDGMRDGMDKYVSEMEQWVNSVRESTQEWFSMVGDGIYVYGQEASDGYGDGIYDGYEDVVNSAESVASGAESAFSGTEEEVQIDGVNIVSGLQSGMEERWGELLEWIAEKKEELTLSLSELEEAMMPVGEGIINGLAHGMESMWYSVEEWAKKIEDTFSSAKSTEKNMEYLQSVATKIADSAEITGKDKTGSLDKQKYKIADLTQITKNNSVGKVVDLREYNKKTNYSGTDVKNQNARDMSVSMITAINQAIVPALQKIGNTTVELKGDAKGLFDAVVKENSKYKTITGASAMR